MRNRNDDATCDWSAYIAALIDTRGERPSDLARAMGVNNSMISRWLTDRGTPDMATLRKISQNLDVPLLELLVRAGHLTPEEARMTAPLPMPKAPTMATPEEAIRADERIPTHHREVLEAVFQVIRQQTGDDPWRRPNRRPKPAV